MRRGFALLEVLVALVVFSILILASSKILLESTSHHLNLTQTQLRHIEIQNALFILSNHIKSSPSITLSSNTLKVYPLNLEVFYSPTFSPIPKQCQADKIEFFSSSYIYSQMDDKVFRVIGEKNGVLRLDAEVQCGLLFPLLPPSTFTLNAQNDLLKDTEVLLKNVKRFEVLPSARGVRVILCDCEMEIARSYE